jgi:FHS family L-fucose permease-like MFS transporter
VKVPYLVIAGIFLAVAAMIGSTRLPEVGSETESSEMRPKLRDVCQHGHLVRGALAQLLYVGAQVGVASFVIRFAEYLAPGTPDKTAANYLKLHLLGFMIGRFTGSAMMKYIPAPRLLGVFAGAATVCVIGALTLSGGIPIWAVVLIGFFHSIMFPTIFALSIKGLGPHTKLGSSLLVMAIIGGAIFPALMGYISDATNIQRAFLVPLVCYAYILYFSVNGHQKAALPSGAPSLAMEIE